MWEAKPKLIKSGPEADAKMKVEISSDNKISQEQQLLGILKLELNNWITEIGDKDWKGEKYGKFCFYDTQLLDRPEFAFPNHLLWNVFSEKERKLFQEVVQRAIAADGQKQGKPEDVKTGKEEKAVKKEVAKGAKKKPVKEGQAVAVDIEDIEAPTQDAYVVLEKNFRTGASGYSTERQRILQEEAKKKAEEAKGAGLIKKKDLTEEQKQKAKAEKKEQSIKRIERYFDIVMGGKMGVILRVRINGLEVAKKEEEKKVEEKKEEKKGAAKPKAKEVKKK